MAWSKSEDEGNQPTAAEPLKRPADGRYVSSPSVAWTNMATPEIPELPEEILRAADVWNNRKRYASFDLQTLHEIQDEQLEQAILDYIFAKLDADYAKAGEILRGLSKGFQAVYVSWLVEAEVMNGGFNQYFWNSSNQFAEATAAALREIGAPQAAILMEQALTLAIAEIPTMKKFRLEATLEAFSESYKHTELNHLDAPFCELAMGFPALRLRYIRANEALFVTS